MGEGRWLCSLICFLYLLCNSGGDEKECLPNHDRGEKKKKKKREERRDVHLSDEGKKHLAVAREE